MCCLPLLCRVEFLATNLSIGLYVLLAPLGAEIDLVRPGSGTGLGLVNIYNIHLMKLAPGDNKKHTEEET